MANGIAPFLMFEGRAQEAIDFYLAQFPGAEVLSMQRYGADGPGPEGSIVVARVALAGQTIMFSDSFVKHPFGFTPAISLFVDCADAAEIDRLAAALAQDGQVLMPLGDYGFSRRFAWVGDRFGVTWQLNLA
jgi:predicted 3-demethylubiquinone-9 3-methyltransferase (glyoxalase superfamily)